MQRPLIKDGKVINVIEIDDETESVTKAEHKEMLAAENADYAERMAAWRTAISAHQQTLAEARSRSFVAMGIANAMRIQAATATGREKTVLENRIDGADEQARAATAEVAALETAQLPKKPSLVRTKRWMCPPGVELGPAGGNIGDTWNGKTYTREAKGG